MSPANIYRFFGAKSEINAAVARLLMGEVEAAIDAVADGPGTAGERLARLVETNETMNRDRYIVDRKLHDMVEAAIAEHWPIVADHIAHIDAALERVVASGMESGELRTRRRAARGAARAYRLHPFLPSAADGRMRRPAGAEP